MDEKREIEVQDPDGKPSTRELLAVVLKGGPLPHGKEFEFTVNGEQPKHVTSVELHADVNDVMRIRTEQILVHADVNVWVAGWKKTIVADVRLHYEEDIESVKVTGKGASAIEALEDAVKQLKERQ